MRVVALRLLHELDQSAHVALGVCRDFLLAFMCHRHSSSVAPTQNSLNAANQHIKAKGVLIVVDVRALLLDRRIATCFYACVLDMIRFR